MDHESEINIYTIVAKFSVIFDALIELIDLLSSLHK